MDTPNNSAAALPARPSVGQEVADCWRQLPDKWLFLALLAVWSLVFQLWGNSTFGVFGRPTPSLFEWMYLVFTSSDDDFHGLLVLPGVLVLLFLNRQELLGVAKKIWWPAFGLVLLAMVLHIGGYLVQQPRVSIVAYFTGLYGLTGLVWGRTWLRATFFPMFLFAFCVPLGAVGDALTQPLRMVVSKIAVFICNTFLGIPVLRDGVQIFSATGGYKYEVAAACSGIRSLISLLALTLVYGFLSFKSPWRRLAMVVSSVPLAVLGNVLRLTVVIIAAEAFGQEAGLRIETKFGFITFALAMAGVLVLGRLLTEPKLAKPAAGPVKAADGAGHPGEPGVQAGPGSRPKWLVLGLFLALVAVMAGVLKRTASFHNLGQPGLKMVAQPVYDEKTNIINTTTVALPESVLEYRSRPLPVTTTEVEFLPKDTTFARRLYTANNSPAIMTSVILMGTDRGSIHQPQICLTGQGWQIERAELVRIPMTLPHPYELQVMKMTAGKRVKTSSGKDAVIRSLFVYWFVADKQLTARHGERMWWMARDLVLTGTLQRWAYVACWSQCLPGQEAATFDKMKAFLAASVPQFQLASGTAAKQ